MNVLNKVNILFKKGILVYLITIFLLFFLFLQVDFSDVLQIIKRSNLRFLLFAIFFSLIAQFFISFYKWFLGVEVFTGKISLIKLFPMWVGSYFLKGIFPLKLGELLRIKYMRENYSLSWGESSFSSLFNMYSDFLLVIFFLIMGGLNLPSLKFNFTFKFIVLLIGLIIIVIILWSKRGKIEQYVNLNNSEKNSSIKGIFDVVKKFNIKRRITIYSISALFIVVEMLVYYFVFKSLKINISAEVLFSILPVVLLISYLPVSILGIGSRELAIVTFYYSYGSIEQLFSAGIIVSFVGYIIPMLIGAAFAGRFLNNLKFHDLISN